MKEGFATYILSLLLFLFSYPTWAQLEFKTSFHNINTENGLSSSEVYRVGQDSKGIIWICSDGGVTRYDGHYFKTFTRKDGLPDNVIFDFVEDAKGRIWFISHNSLLSYYEKGQIVNYEYNNIIAEKTISIVSDYKQLIVQDGGTILYSLHKVGLLKISPEGECENLLGSNNLLCFFDEPEYRISAFHFEAGAPGTPYDLLFKRKNTKRSLQKSSKWLVRHRWLKPAVGNENLALINSRIVDIETGKTILEESQINHAAILDDTTLWLCTLRGLVKYRLYPKGKVEYRQTYLEGIPISSIDQDLEGGYWIGSLTDGVYHVNSFDVEYCTKSEGLIENNVIRVSGNEKAEMLFSFVGYSQKLNGESVEFKGQKRETRCDLFKGYTVTASLIRDQSKIRGNEICISNSKDLAVAENYMYGVLNRIHRYSLVNGALMDDTLYDGFWDLSPSRQLKFTAVCALNDDLVLAGSNKGLFYPKDRKIYEYLEEKEYQSSSVSDIIVTQNFGLVVSTHDKGLLFIADRRVHKVIGENEGLLSDQVNCLHETSDGDLMIGTNHGVNFISSKDGRIRTLSKSSGLRGGDVNAIGSDARYIYVGTRKGLYRVQKELFYRQRKQIPSQVIPEWVELNAKRSNVGNGKLKMDYNSSLLKVRFRTINYTNQLNKAYQYRIIVDGQTQNWIEIFSPEVTLVNPKGDFILQVRYRLEETEWSNPFTLLNVRENIPFHARPFFWMIIGILIVLLWFLVIYTIQKRKEQKLITESRIIGLEQRIQNARLNPHFIFNVLNSIQSFLLFNENKEAEEYLGKFSDLMRNVLSKSNKGVIALQDELQITKGYLELECLRYEERFDVKIENNIADKNVLIPSLLIQPLAENAVFHGVSRSKSNQRILIEVKETERADAVEVKMTNSGVMSAEQREQFEQSDDTHALGINRLRLRNYNSMFKRRDLGISIEVDEHKRTTSIIVRLPLLEKE